MPGLRRTLRPRATNRKGGDNMEHGELVGLLLKVVNSEDKVDTIPEDVMAVYVMDTASIMIRDRKAWKTVVRNAESITKYFIVN